MSPQENVKDFEDYAASFGFRLSQQARELVDAFENSGLRNNKTLAYYIILPELIELIPQLRALIIRKGANPYDAIAILKTEIEKSDHDDKYADSEFYSEDGYRGGYRAQIADYSIAAARRHGRSEILAFDLLEGYLDAHDEEFPPIDNASWTDEALHVAYNTLAHIRGRYNASLWVKFNDIREELNLQTADSARKEPLDVAPQYLKHSVLYLLSEHPDYRRNCFLIMPFKETTLHKEIHKTLKRVLEIEGFNLLRADDKAYSENVFGNIETYMYGCKFAISVHERAISDAHNPNVALEIGYMLGMKKPVCLLKEKTVASLPSDLQGRLYVEFDAEKIEETIKINMEKWLKSKNLSISHNR